MSKKTLANIGAMIKKKRGDRKLRETSTEIGIGPATLMRVENGYTPDIGTFSKLCKWLKVNPGEFLGFQSPPSSESQNSTSLSVHMRAAQTPPQETINALARMILLATGAQPKPKE